MSKDKTPKVTGIGGIFFFAKDTTATKKWYQEQLGFDTDQWGATFATRNIDQPEEVNFLQWSLFEQNSDYFKPSDKEFMVNYRVQNLDGLLEQLRANGVQILDEVASYDYGRFVHILDPEGNKIELWEPIDDKLLP